MRQFSEREEGEVGRVHRNDFFRDVDAEADAASR